MDEIIKIVVQRLAENGVAVNRIPSCVAAMWESLVDFPIQDHQELNHLMQTLGWSGFKMDEHTFNLFMLIINDMQPPQLREYIKFAVESNLEDSFYTKTQ